jgi:hypothetical protein
MSPQRLQRAKANSKLIRGQAKKPIFFIYESSSLSADGGDTNGELDTKLNDVAP